jgi:galactokinase
VPETIALAGLARRLGAEAASAFGAGFGGAVWALVDEDESQRFLARWRTEYRVAVEPATRTRSTFFVSPAGPPATGPAAKPAG